MTRALLAVLPRLVARIPAAVHSKLLVAFLIIVGLLIVLGGVGLEVLGDVNRRSEDLVKLQRKIAAYRCGVGSWGFLGRPASECGTLCRGDGGQGRGDRREMALISASLAERHPCLDRPGVARSPAIANESHMELDRSQ